MEYKKVELKEIVGWWLPRAEKREKREVVHHRAQTSSYEISKFWEFNVQHDDYN